MFLLESVGLTKRFGGLTALSNVCFKVREGQIMALIGPNGAGKSTCFLCLTGYYRPDGGEILYAGEPITGLPPHQIARAGVAWTFQQARLFPNMSVIDNVVAGYFHRFHTGVLANVLQLRSAREELRKVRETASRLLEDLGLNHLAHHNPGELPFGSARMVELARALMAQPRLLLLDEPASGLNPIEINHLAATLLKVRKRGVTVLLIEHNMRLVMGISDYIVVLNHGIKLSEGSPEAVRADPEVIEAYLGKRLTYVTA